MDYTTTKESCGVFVRFRAHFINLILGFLSLVAMNMSKEVLSTFGLMNEI
jgi:hypothetical protein